MVRRLGDSDFAVREQASSELVSLGRVAVKYLEEARNDADLEVKSRAERCLEKIRSGSAVSLPAAVARLIAAKKPAGAAEALLAFISTVENDGTAVEIRAAFVAVALEEGKASPALVAALADKEPLIRAAAAEALTGVGAKEQQAAIAKLLADDSPLVRLRVALARTRALDKDAVPVLIDSLAHFNSDQLWQAEELLFHLGGEGAPQVPLGTDEAGRKKCRDAWTAWWTANRDKIDLTKLGNIAEPLGYTLLVMPTSGKVVELGRDGKPRWELTQLGHPYDARWLPGNRVLVAEFVATASPNGT